ncbi:MAG: DEAD/DEAH box helicase family protein [Candidatus Njordarchaeota archaeon]
MGRRRIRFKRSRKKDKSVGGITYIGRTKPDEKPLRYPGGEWDAMVTMEWDDFVYKMTSGKIRDLRALYSVSGDRVKVYKLVFKDGKGNQHVLERVSGGLWVATRTDSDGKKYYVVLRNPPSEEALAMIVNFSSMKEIVARDIAKKELEKKIGKKVSEEAIEKKKRVIKKESKIVAKREIQEEVQGQKVEPPKLSEYERRELKNILNGLNEVERRLQLLAQRIKRTKDLSENDKKKLLEATEEQLDKARLAKLKIEQWLNSSSHQKKDLENLLSEATITLNKAMMIRDTTMSALDQLRMTTKQETNENIKRVQKLVNEILSGREISSEDLDFLASHSNVVRDYLKERGVEDIDSFVKNLRQREWYEVSSRDSGNKTYTLEIEDLGIIIEKHTDWDHLVEIKDRIKREFARAKYDPLDRSWSINFVGQGMSVDEFAEKLGAIFSDDGNYIEEEIERLKKDIKNRVKLRNIAIDIDFQRIKKEPIKTRIEETTKISKHGRRSIKESYDRLILTLPKNIPQKDLEEIINEIMNLGTLTYYVKDSKKGELVPKHIRVVEYKRTPSGIELVIPPFLGPHVEALLRKRGYNIEIDYGIKPYAPSYIVRSEIKLRKYQRDALDAWKANLYSGTIVIPTGGGKTFVALGMIRDLKKPTLIVVPTKDLVDQWYKHLTETLSIPKKYVGRLYSGEKDYEKPIVIATYQGLTTERGKKIEDKISEDGEAIIPKVSDVSKTYAMQLKDKFEVLVFDEAHRVPAETFRLIGLLSRAPYRMALSATPERDDKNEILLFKIAGKKVMEIPYARLVREKAVAPLVIHKVFVKPTERDAVILSEAERKFMYSRSRKIRAQALATLKAILSNAEAKQKAVVEIVKKELKKHPNARFFIFLSRKNGQRRYIQLLKEHGITGFEALKSDMSRKSRKALLERFRSGKTRGIVVVKVADEGLDVPEADVAIIVAGSAQKRQMVQRIGRVVRYRPNKIARVYEIILDDSIKEREWVERRDPTLWMKLNEIRDIIKKHGYEKPVIILREKDLEKG